MTSGATVFPLIGWQSSSHSSAKTANMPSPRKPGIQKGDVLVSFDGKDGRMSESELLAYSLRRPARGRSCLGDVRPRRPAEDRDSRRAHNRPLTGSSRDEQVGDETHHRLVFLVHGLSPHLDDALIGPRLRRPDLDHVGYDVERVARPHGPRPLELLRRRRRSSPRES